MKESDVTGPFQGIVFKRHILNCYLLRITSHLNSICVIMQKNRLIVPVKRFASSHIPCI